MGIDCYYHPFSSPSRGEQYTPEFLKMNPNHAVPTLDDDGFYLYDSRSIMKYLANAYAKGDTMYPKDPKKRYLVDQRLMLDVDTYQAFANVFYPPAFFKQKIEPDKVKKLDEALERVSKYLDQTTYIAGNSMTIADFSTAATLSTIQECGHDVEKLPSIKRYLTRCKEEILGWIELNQQGAEQYGQFIQNAVQNAQK
ncbi:unnamed protein product [Allacma fusca]|uniref:Glutathione S-transferase n=1 Tax=Allacma fusca TaxID=39272 RepID=A0A8J2Q7B7_9HEXA|nr:unnamed protein product [Allacma fusca]